MSIGFRDERRRRSRRTRIVSVVLALAVLGGSVFAAYREGLRQTWDQADRAAAHAEQLNDQVLQLQRAAAAAQAATDQARAALAQLEQRYRRDVPNGPIVPVLQAAAQRLAAGVQPERLIDVLGRVENRRSCEPATSRRFIVRTPIDRNAANSVAFADNTITVAAEGVPSRDGSGNPEGWFDPAQPVSAKFVIIGGKAEEVSGKLPLQHSVLAGEYEHRFTLVPGPRGFVVVTADRCRFP